MKNLANIITICRIVLSPILFAFKPFSTGFNVIYILCGLSDILDGNIARKTKTESNQGAKLDSIADLIFIIVCLVKILSVININKSIFIWIGIIIAIKLINFISSFIIYKKIVMPHTIANKITGAILFVFPLTLSFVNINIASIPVCALATFAAVWEGHYIRTKNIEKL